MSGPPDDTRARGLPGDVTACVRTLARAAGGQLVGVIFFGSRLLHTSPDAHSAADLFVVVEDYDSFYSRLRESGLVRGRAWWLAMLNRWLAPNVLSVDPGDGSGPACKCFVIDRASFSRAMSVRARDHFCRGRLAQIVMPVHARDAEDRKEIDALLRTARRESLIWVPDLLPPRFTVEDYCLAMLRASFEAEIRPESPDRVREVFEAQRERMSEAFEQVLRDRGPAFGIVAEGSAFRRGDRRPWLARARQRLWFERSRIRATLRWVKYVQTYEGWLDYIVHKVHRRTGMQLEITEAERRWPFLLLWPKFISVMIALRRSRSSNPSQDSEP
jgi:hypothetical protein